MEARFVGVVILVTVVVAASPVALLALRPGSEDARPWLLFVGSILLATSLLVRPLLLAGATHADPGMRRTARRRRSLGSAVGMTVGICITAVGVFAVVPPLEAGAFTAGGLAVLILVVVVLDRYADRVAATDSTRASSASGLGPFALARRLHDLVDGDGDRSKLIGRAIVRERVDQLSERNQALAPVWADTAWRFHRGQTLLFAVQVVAASMQGATAMDPAGVEPRVWLSLAWLVAAGGGAILSARQWRRCRAFAHTHGYRV